MRFGTVRIKGAYRHFDIMRLYGEQQGVVSAGRELEGAGAASVDVTVTRLWVASAQSRVAARAGATLRVARRYATLVLQGSGIPVRREWDPTIGEPPGISLGLHTRRHAAGGMGSVGEVVFDPVPRLRLRHGFEYRLHETVAFSVAVQTEPFLLALGLSLELHGHTSTVALVNHPVLGWSRGAGALFSR